MPKEYIENRSINSGTSQFSDFKLGDSQVERVYRGDDLIWGDITRLQPRIQTTSAMDNTSKGATVSMSYPTGITSGDFLYLTVSFRITASVLALPTGWNKVFDNNIASRAYSYWKIADGTETGTFTWSQAEPGTTAIIASMTMFRYDRVDIENPIQSVILIDPAGTNNSNNFITTTVTGFPTNINNNPNRLHVFWQHRIQNSIGGVTHTTTPSGSVNYNRSWVDTSVSPEDFYIKRDSIWSDVTGSIADRVYTSTVTSADGAKAWSAQAVILRGQIA